ncbi:uncharacterized protein [Aristolochia californica]|uniref:uncharacterized protein n=1 Tax=Aristolochia californica TaxID=171875 RepID=UPI0035DA0BB7
MPNYVEFLKNIISKKRRLEEFETVKLSEECSAILQKKWPKKLKDPGSFTLPCTIGNSFFDKVLCDLGASINLMPLSVFKKLGLGEMKQIISLQLADRSIKYPRGIMEDVLVKVDKFIFPSDFVLLDMEEDEKVQLILGRPFLATGRALIDVQKGELTLRVNKEEVMFNIYQAMKFAEDPSTCLQVTSLSNEVGSLEPMVAKIDSMNSKEKMQQTTTPELKQLPEQLRYAFLGDAYENAKIYKEGTKKWHDKQILRREFASG